MCWVGRGGGGIAIQTRNSKSSYSHQDDRFTPSAGREDQHLDVGGGTVVVPLLKSLRSSVTLGNYPSRTYDHAGLPSCLPYAAATRDPLSRPLPSDPEPVPLYEALAVGRPVCACTAPRHSLLVCSSALARGTALARSRLGFPETGARVTVSVSDTLRTPSTSHVSLGSFCRMPFQQAVPHRAG